MSGRIVDPEATQHATVNPGSADVFGFYPAARNILVKVRKMRTFRLDWSRASMDETGMEGEVGFWTWLQARLSLRIWPGPFCFDICTTQVLQLFKQVAGIRKLARADTRIQLGSRVSHIRTRSAQLPNTPQSPDSQLPTAAGRPESGERLLKSGVSGIPPVRRRRTNLSSRTCRQAWL